jgi:hypothetical protein
MIGDIVLGAAGVLLSLGVALAVIWSQGSRAVETRGMVGLAATILHLVLSLAVPLAIWAAWRPEHGAAFMLSVLVFYWLSLIILVVAIIRWLRSAPPRPATAPDSKE